MSAPVPGPAAPKGSMPSPPSTAAAIATITRSTSTSPGTDIPATLRPVTEVPWTVREEAAVSTSSKALALKARSGASFAPRLVAAADVPGACPEEGLRAERGGGAGDAAERAELVVRRGAEPADAADSAEGPEVADR